MSGHNKWSSIKHRKGAQDAKRSKIFSRIAKMIIVSAQQGGGDPEMNNSLKLLLLQARKANMPKDNIERAIKRGTGEGGDIIKFEEVSYEAMGPDGSAIIINCTTDNTNRALTEVKIALKKNGGKFVPSGSVSFQFKHLGHIVISTDDLDSAELSAIEAGAEDIERGENELLVITEPTELHTIRENLEKDGFTIEKAELTYTSQQPVILSEASLESFIKLKEALEDVDDVQDIFDNVTNSN